MKKQITSISPVQTAKVFALLYFFITIPFLLLMVFSLSISDMPNSFPVAMLITAPFIYAIFGFIFTLFGAWIYNISAKWVGGIEFTTSEQA